jgi:N-acetylglucosamine-6-sulfatase
MNVDPSQKFFALLSVPSPHDPFTPEEKYSNRFPNLTALKTESFNRGPGSNEKHWLMTMPPSELDAGVLGDLDKIYRKRWQTLLSVDDLVEDVVITLSNLGVLNDTYIIFTSDNGYHIGQHAQPFDKRQPYETDINIPLLIRGPGIKPKTAVEQPVALIDLLPTILNWAEVSFDLEEYDGAPLNDLFNDSVRNESYERHILVEYWGEFNDDWVRECPWSRREKLFVSIVGQFSWGSLVKKR